VRGGFSCILALVIIPLGHWGRLPWGNLDILLNRKGFPIKVTVIGHPLLCQSCIHLPWALGKYRLCDNVLTLETFEFSLMPKNISETPLENPPISIFLPCLLRRITPLILHPYQACECSSIFTVNEPKAHIHEEMSMLKCVMFLTWLVWETLLMCVCD
jgi:hypothetical protein